MFFLSQFEDALGIPAGARRDVAACVAREAPAIAIGLGYLQD